MITTKEYKGKTTDDAINKALAELGLDRDDVSIEILERGKTGFLGIGSVEAVVSISYEIDDAEAAEVPAVSFDAASDDTVLESVQEETVQGSGSEQTADHSAGKKIIRAEGKQAEETERFLSGLLERMGVNADIEITPREGGGLNVDLSGPGIGAVIGRRGETLDAIQHLTNYVVNRGSDKRSHINVDAENYRAKREESLVRLAEKMAGKAVKYKRSMYLEPMNSYERHVIHAALQDDPRVNTSSTGTEPNRRVVVSYVPQETEKKSDTNYKEWC